MGEGQGTAFNTFFISNRLLLALTLSHQHQHQLLALPVAIFTHVVRGSVFSLKPGEAGWQRNSYLDRCQAGTELGVGTYLDSELPL